MRIAERIDGVDFAFAPQESPDKLTIMTGPAKDLTKRALALKAKERVDLAETLLASVEEFTSAEVKAAWLKETARRIKNFEEGRMNAAPAAEVLSRARTRLDEIRMVLEEARA